MNKKTLAYNYNKYTRMLLSGLKIVGKPSLFILGAQKAATTSLSHYLNFHKELCSSSIKEVRFFNHDEIYSKGLKWYHSNFPRVKPGIRYFYEATPEYLYYPWVPERIYEYDPESKFIILLREPISRTYSAYNMYKRFSQNEKVIKLYFETPAREGKEIEFHKYFFSGAFPSFDQWVDIELDLIKNQKENIEPGLIRRSIYHLQIERYLKYFDKKNFLFLSFDDMVQEPQEQLHKINRFLDVQDIIPSKNKFKPKNKHSYGKEINSDTFKKLENYFQGPNQRLSELIGEINW